MASTSRSRNLRRSLAGPLSSGSIAGVSQTSRTWSEKARAEATGRAVDAVDALRPVGAGLEAEPHRPRLAVLLDLDRDREAAGAADARAFAQAPRGAGRARARTATAPPSRLVLPAPFSPTKATRPASNRTSSAA